MYTLSIEFKDEKRPTVINVEDEMLDGFLKAIEEKKVYWIPSGERAFFYNVDLIQRYELIKQAVVPKVDAVADDKK